MTVNLNKKIYKLTLNRLPRAGDSFPDNGSAREFSAKTQINKAY